MKVPSYYICPTIRFDKEKHISLCEFEFPAYFNFFVLKTKIKIIANKECEIEWGVAIFYMMY